MEKGCVYFFRHIGLSPIKIGYSTHESPISRFEQFKTYAPFGAELLGFIRTNEAKELETILHERFSYARLKGEWFEIKENDVNLVVDFYSNIEDIKEKNEFQIAWAKTLSKKTERNNTTEECAINFFKLFSLEKNNSFEIYSQKELMEILKADRKTMTFFLEANNLERKSQRVNGKLKNGYKIYKKKVTVP